MIERFLNKCNRIARALHNNIINKNGLPKDEQWQKWIITANRIHQEFETELIIWPTSVSSADLTFCRKKVNQVNTFLLRLHKSQTELISRRQISQYFEQRCGDIKHNQSRMIDSILERPHRRIKLDRVMLSDGSLTLDDNELNNKVIEHFQNIAGPSDTNISIPESWQQDYLPLPTVNEDCYHTQLRPVDLHELNGILSTCPNGKAAGTSTITYEMVRHSSKTFKNKLVELYNMCITTGLTPTKWKHALLFPIPKPMEWECDINKTRPIVLLEIFRKIFVKIITARLSTTLVEHNILKGGNHAGIPGGSTFEPIRILESIRSDAVTQNKPLFIYFQDMSKAYDRVRLDILKLAMLRLKIPVKLIDLILSVFTNRTNAIITENGYTPTYNVLIGIDQGEVISPLLWTIYYDPLLTRLRNNNLGYELSVPKYTDINRPPQIIKTRYAVSAFLDDTELYNSSTNDLSYQVTTTNSFYKFTNIKVNNDKAILLTTDKNAVDVEGYITLIIDGREVKYKITPNNEQVRFLGIHFNMDGKRTQLIKQLTDISKHAMMTINRKKVTPDHVTYIVNRVLIPRMEYLLQVNVLLESECNSVMAPLRKLLRHKARFHNTLSNNMLHLAEPYGLKDLFQHEITVHLDWLNIQLNDKGILREMSIIKLMQIQKKY